MPGHCGRLPAGPYQWRAGRSARQAQEVCGFSLRCFTDGCSSNTPTVCAPRGTPEHQPGCPLLPRAFTPAWEAALTSRTRAPSPTPTFFRNFTINVWNAFWMLLQEMTEPTREMNSAFVPFPSATRQLGHAVTSRKGRLECGRGVSQTARLHGAHPLFPGSF